MPDIQTALSNALTQSRVREIPSDWDKENSTTKDNTVQPYRFQPTNNVTRETFNFVRDNPGLRAKQIIERMVARNFNASSVGSLLGQLARNSLVALDRNTRTYHAIAEQYVPIKVSTLKASREAEKKAARAAARAAKKAVQSTQPKVEDVVQPVVEKEYDAPAIPTPAATTAEEPPMHLTAAKVLETLSIKEAHILYRELQTMFG